MDFELVEEDIPKAKIRVIGIGGSGGNAVNNMIMSGMTGVDFVVVNTDAQDWLVRWLLVVFSWGQLTRARCRCSSQWSRGCFRRS